jgi:hypothetical protein
MAIFAIVLIVTSPAVPGARILFLAQHWCQSSLSLLLFPCVLAFLGSQSFAVHFPEARVRFFGFPGEQSSIVVVRLADYVAQEIRIGLRRAGLQSRIW